MSWQSISGVVFPAAIASVITIVVVWLFKLGKTKPGVAYFSPIATAFAALLTTGFLLYGVANALYDLSPSPWMHALSFAGGAAFLCGTIDSAVYRISWDRNGFRVRRFIGKSFTAQWSQVKAVIGIAGQYGAEFRVELDHPQKKAFCFSSFLVGNKEFRAMLRRETPHVVP